MGIFARELKAILEAHRGDDLGVWEGQGPRTDPVWYPLRRLAIYAQQIKRLKLAAQSEAIGATLPPDDLERVAEVLHLTADEQRRLRAALLAQGVEMLLADRLSPAEYHVVRQATEATFAMLYRSDIPALRYVRQIALRQCVPLDDPYERAMAAFDRAGQAEWMAHFAAAAGHHDEAQDCVSRALAAYKTAQFLFDPISDSEELEQLNARVSAIRGRYCS